MYVLCIPTLLTSVILYYTNTESISDFDTSSDFMAINPTVRFHSGSKWWTNPNPCFRSRRSATRSSRILTVLLEVAVLVIFVMVLTVVVAVEVQGV